MPIPLSRSAGAGPASVRYLDMTFIHPRLAGGKPVEVEGCSALTFADDGRVQRHRDYFDAGAMLYEQLPLMGSAIRWLKKRLA
ncbi:hypothetical protein HORIV_01980 [Vreelandella olivaria]|uniref:SnoaL-like domain-containing protein n=1 Tax=Vreelandella olivaria TaxID=390919 RepID=A0ABM7GAW6_9GAMM|nr:hypothetical protein HORIV_01980 [Halomonas olivaria]